MDKYKKLMDEALIAGRNRNYSKSIHILTGLLSETDEIPEAILYLGRSYHAIKEYQKAISLFQLLLTRENSPSTHFFLGRSLLAIEENHKAIYHLNQSLKNTKQAETYCLLGTAFLKARIPEKAVEAFQTGVELAPDNGKIFIGYLNALMTNAVRLFRNGETEISRQIFIFLIKNGNQSITPHIYLASIYKETKDYANALNHYNKALMIQPDDIDLCAQRAALYLEMGEMDKAKEQFSNLHKRDPSIPDFSENKEETTFALALKLFEEEKYTQVIQACREQLKINHNNINARLLMAETLRSLGNLPHATNHINQLLKIDEHNIQARFTQLMILWEEENFPKVDHVLSIIQRLDPYNSLIPYYLALCRCHLNYPIEENIEALEALLPTSDPDIFLRKALGQQNYEAGHYKEALIWYKKVLDLDPSNQSALKTIANIKNPENTKGEKKGKSPKEYIKAMEAYLALYDDAEDLLQYIQFLVHQKEWNKAINWIDCLSTQKDTDYSRMQAYCLRKAGRYKEASIIYRNLLLKDPKNPVLTKALLYSLSKSGNKKRAILIAQKASAYLKSAEIDLILGTFYFEDGKTDQALDIFRKITQEFPKEWRAYHNISSIYMQKGEVVMAEKFAAHARKYKTIVRA